MRLRNSGLLSRVVGVEIMVLDLETSQYVMVKGSGTLLYKLLKTDQERGDLVRALLDTYDVDEARAVADVDDFVRRLDDAGLLEGVPA